MCATTVTVLVLILVLILDYVDTQEGSICKIVTVTANIQIYTFVLHIFWNFMVPPKHGTDCFVVPQKAK